jgi:HSP20 family protein
MATAKNKEIEAKDKRMIRALSNICEKEGSILLRLEMPGVKKDDLDINIENNQLKIRGRRELPAESDKKYIIRERRQGDFYQIYTLDETVDRNKVEANLENGVLVLTLHLKEAEKPKKITVKAG